MNKTKQIVTIAMLLTFCLMLSVSAMAINDLGVSYTATLNTSEIYVSDVDQTVTLTIAANKTVDVDGIAFTVVTPSGFGTAVGHPEIPFTKADYYEPTKVFGWSHDWAEFDYYSVVTIAVITYTIPANTPAGEYTLGFEELSLTNDYGWPWEEGAAINVTLTIADTPSHTCTLTEVAGQAATCIADGWNNYYKCSDETCGKLYADANGETEITLDAWKIGEGKIPATGTHTDATNDGDHICDTDGCNETVGTHEGGEATCVAKAVCTECGQSYGELAPNNHKNTYTADGFHPDSSDSAYHYQWLACSDCTNKTIKKVNRAKHDDQMGDHNHSCDACGQENITVCTPGEDDGDCTTAIHCTECNAVTTPAKEAHVAGEDDHNCTTAVKCVNCDKNAVEAKTHVDGDDNNHACDNPGCTVDNVDGGHHGGTATCQAAAVCDECGQPYGEKDASNHTSVEVTYKNVTATTHDEYHKCCDTLKTADVPHNFENAEHKCVCGKVETFTFTWIKENGDVVYTETVEYGKDALNIPALPYEKPGYTASWSHNGKGITENTTITMVFTENTYRVEVYSANGKTLLETRQHKYTTWTSSNVTNFNGIPGTGTSLEGHGFVGFSLEPNGEKVCSTTIYRISVITDNAVYDAERGVYIVKLYVVIGPLQYSISYWVDGKIYSSDRYEYGAAITPETRIPHKAQDGCSVYTFAGWDKEIPATMPAGNVEIHATFTETKNHTGKPVYTDNKNGTHSAAYACCNAPYVTNEAHDYVTPNHEDKTYDCVCGAQEEIKLPEVVVTDIKNSLTSNDPNLTFALNFAIKDLANLDEEYLAKVLEIYGNYYTDYVLTISGLTKESVIFNANGNADGYLAGQYDAWSENWVTVPFENVTVKNEESLYIMEYAAKLMGKQGLRFTLAEIAMIVQNFDCGVYFTPEFLAANPNLKVTLELKVFTEDAQGNKENDISVAKNDFNNNVVSGWNNIDGDWYYVINGGLAHGLVRVPYPAQSTGILSDLAYERLAEDIAYAERKGIEFIDADTAWFVFGTDGKLVQETKIEDGKYIENGMIPWHPGFVEVGGVWYYFVGDAEKGGNKPANGEIYVTRNTTAAGYASGDLVTFVNGQIKADLDGIVNGYYYENGKLMAGAGLVEIEDGKYIYVSSNGAVVVDTTYWPTKTNDTGIIPNMYEFDANGILQNPEFKDPNATTGVFSGYYYEDGEIVAGKGLVQIGNDIYYVRSNGKVATGKYYVTNVSNYEGDFDIESGAKLFFAEDGKMLPIKNGVVDGYYYVNNHILYGAGLIEDEEGNIYYVRSNGKVAVGEYYVTNVNEMGGFKSGDKLIFDKDGKLTK